MQKFGVFEPSRRGQYGHGLDRGTVVAVKNESSFCGKTTESFGQSCSPQQIDRVIGTVRLLHLHANSFTAIHTHNVPGGEPLARGLLRQRQALQSELGRKSP